MASEQGNEKSAPATTAGALRERRSDFMTSDELRQWLMVHRMTVQQLSEALPVSRRTLEGWLQGRKSPEYLGRALSDIAREVGSVAVEQNAATDSQQRS